jgi:hypothetical protein
MTNYELITLSVISYQLSAISYQLSVIRGCGVWGWGVMVLEKNIVRLTCFELITVIGYLFDSYRDPWVWVWMCKR